MFHAGGGVGGGPLCVPARKQYATHKGSPARRLHANKVPAAQWPHPLDRDNATSPTTVAATLSGYQETHSSSHNTSHTHPAIESHTHPVIGSWLL